MEIPVCWNSRIMILNCPNDWNWNGSTIDLNAKKIVEIHTYKEEDSESLKTKFEDAETKQIGEHTFWMYSEKYNILEKPNWIPYVIWQYYCFDGKYYYRIAFFQDQENMPVTLEEFEDVLKTMKITKPGA